LKNIFIAGYHFHISNPWAKILYLICSKDSVVRSVKGNRNWFTCKTPKNSELLPLFHLKCARSSPLGIKERYPLGIIYLLLITRGKWFKCLAVLVYVIIKFSTSMPCMYFSWSVHVPVICLHRGDWIQMTMIIWIYTLASRLMTCSRQRSHYGLVGAK